MVKPTTSIVYLRNISSRLLDGGELERTETFTGSKMVHGNKKFTATGLPTYPLNMGLSIPRKLVCIRRHQLTCLNLLLGKGMNINQ